MELSLYKIIRIPKKNGFRIIHAPCEELKAKQREYLWNEIRGRPRWPRGLTAFLPGRSIKDAAKPHIGKKFLVHVDIKDFFHHVTKAHIVRALAFDRYLPREIENRAASLKGVDWRRVGPPFGLLDIAFIPSPKVPGEECLPQGGPLSPHLSLLASKVVYFKIMKMIRNAQIVADVTMYADGIFLSSDDERILRLGKRGVERILVSEGFESNRSKFKVMRGNSSQRVCGITVNRRLSVPKEKRKEIRGRIHNLYMDALSGKEVDVGEFKYLDGYLSFSRFVDGTFFCKYKPWIDFIRMYLSAKKKLPIEGRSGPQGSAKALK